LSQTLTAAAYNLLVFYFHLYDYTKELQAAHLWELHDIVYFAQKTRHASKFERIHIKLCSTGAPTKDDKGKREIDDKHHLIDQL